MVFSTPFLHEGVPFFSRKRFKVSGLAHPDIDAGISGDIPLRDVERSSFFPTLHEMLTMFSKNVL